MSGDDVRDGDAERLAELIRELWLKVKPSRDAQQLRSELSVSFDDPRFKTWASDCLPDCVWDLIDVAYQHGIDSRDAALREKDAEIERLRELFRIDGEQHASFVKNLTERHELRVSKYYQELVKTRAEIERLTLGVDATTSAGDGWRPIDDQAKDGEAWLLAGGKDMYGVMMVCSWDEDHWQTDDGPGYYPESFAYYRPLPPPPAQHKGDDDG